MEKYFLHPPAYMQDNKEGERKQLDNAKAPSYPVHMHKTKSAFLESYSLTGSIHNCHDQQ